MKNILQRMKRAISLGRVLQEMQQQQYIIRHDQLIEKTLNSKESGVSSDRLCEYEVILSLTTYGKRLYEVAATIESIMQGSMKPNRIVLWLENELQDTELPIALKNQQGRGLEVIFCKNVRSYKKLVTALCRFPDSAIITIDDDVIYHYDFVEKLVNAHNRYPNDIIANRMHRMVLGNDGRPVNYMDWEWCVNPPLAESSHLLFFTGVGGVFYPPNSLAPEVTNDAVFMDICPYADDVWFNAMALMAGTKIRKCFTHSPRGEEYVINADVQDIGLVHVNTGKTGGNDWQLKGVFEKYGLWDKLKC